MLTHEFYLIVGILHFFMILCANTYVLRLDNIMCYMFSILLYCDLFYYMVLCCYIMFRKYISCVTLCIDSNYINQNSILLVQFIESETYQCIDAHTKKKCVDKGFGTIQIM